MYQLVPKKNFSKFHYRFTVCVGIITHLWHSKQIYLCFTKLALVSSLYYLLSRDKIFHLILMRQNVPHLACFNCVTWILQSTVNINF